MNGYYLIIGIVFLVIAWGMYSSGNNVTSLILGIVGIFFLFLSTGSERILLDRFQKRQ